MEPVGVKDEEADEKGADNGPRTFQGGNDGTSGTVEFTGIDSSLVSIEVV